MHTDFIERLGHYGLTAAMFTAAPAAKSQVIYHDIDPDIHIQLMEYDNVFWCIDLDNDGVYDFQFEGYYKPVESSPADPASITFSIRGLGVNKVAYAVKYDVNNLEYSYGSSSTFSETITYAGNVVIDFDEGMEINSDLAFTSLAIYSKLKVYDWFEYDTYSVIFGLDSYGERYIGILLNDRFGWIHIDAVDSRNIWVKGYAYRTAANTPIFTGDTNGTASHSIDYGTAGIQDGFQIMPNPAGNDFRLATTNPTSSGNVHIYDASGALVVEFPYAQQHVYDISGYAPGIYLVQLTLEGLQPALELLVIE